MLLKKTRESFTSPNEQNVQFSENVRYIFNLNFFFREIILYFLGVNQLILNVNNEYQKKKKNDSS